MIQYRMLKFSVRQGIIIEKTHEINPFEQSRWLKPYLDFKLQKKL